MSFFISVDWGTSSFRIRLVQAETLMVADEIQNGSGAASSFQEWKNSGNASHNRAGFYIQKLKDQIAILERKNSLSLAGTPVLISGMASSSIGMLELPYREIPLASNGSQFGVQVIPADPNFHHTIYLISGLSYGREVMRGEETIVAGIPELRTGNETMVILPGTHSKHVTVKAGMISAIQTYMSGEFFELLSNKSILSDSVAGKNAEFNEEAFEAGVSDSDQNLLNTAFRVRTNRLFNRFTSEANRSYLSGLIIGTELNSIANKKMAIILASEGQIRDNYLRALRLLKIDLVNTADMSEALVRGQWMIYQSKVENNNVQNILQD